MASGGIGRSPATTMSVAEQDAHIEAVWRACAAGLRGRLLALTRDPAVADDLVSEAFIRLATEVRAGRAPADAAAWLHRVGSNLVVSRARHATVATRAMPGLLERGVAPSPEDELLDRERDRVLHAALAALRRDDREVVVLAAQGYRPEEIASMTGRSAQATRTRLCRARGRLRSSPALAAFVG